MTKEEWEFSREDFDSQEDFIKAIDEFNNECKDVLLDVNSLSRYFNDEGDSQVIYMIAFGGTKRARNYTIQMRFPRRHCEHEYDCCGHWYQHSDAKIIDEADDYTLFSYHLTRNV